MPDAYEVFLKRDNGVKWNSSWIFSFLQKSACIRWVPEVKKGNQPQVHASLPTNIASHPKLAGPRGDTMVP